MKKIIVIGVLLLFIGMTHSQKTDQMVSSEDSPIMYLTFDDGPNQYTKEILDILDHYDIKATFFVTGTRPDYFYLIQEAYNQGHSIGLHCYCHDYDLIYASEEAYLTDLNQIADIVKQATGKESYLLRFPGGSSNRVSEIDMHELIQTVSDLGYRYFDWNGESGDAKVGSNIASVMFSSLQGVNGKRDIMMLCHDRQVTVEVLGTLIEYYQELGYVFLPITMNTDGFCHLK